MRSQCAEHSQRPLLTCPWSWTTHLLHFFHSVSSLSVSIWLSDHLSCSEALLKALFQPPTSPLLHLTYRLYLKIKAYINKLVLKHERHMSIPSYSLAGFFFFFCSTLFWRGCYTFMWQLERWARPMKMTFPRCVVKNAVYHNTRYFGKEGSQEKIDIS